MWDTRSFTGQTSVREFCSNRTLHLRGAHPGFLLCPVVHAQLSSQQLSRLPDIHVLFGCQRGVSQSCCMKGSWGLLALPGTSPARQHVCRDTMTSNIPPCCHFYSMFSSTSVFSWLHYRQLHSTTRSFLPFQAPKRMGISETGIFCRYYTELVTEVIIFDRYDGINVLVDCLFEQCSWGMPTTSMMTSSNGNIYRVTGHLCGEFTGHRRTPCTKASDAELWSFLWSESE